MSLVFACVSAHTPLLMPTIAKDSIATLEKTRASLQALEQELYLAQPETLIVISPHGDALPDALTINFNSKYVSNFEEFGDLVTKSVWKPDTMLIDRIREDMKEKHVPLVMASSERVDYGVAVPLIYLADHLTNVRIVPVITANLDMKTHYEFGKQLKDEIFSTSTRVAVIASVDLSPRVAENSPEGYSPKGVEFDEKVLAVLRDHRPLGILDIDEALAAEAKACGAKALAVLFGMFDDMKFRANVLSYEKPFGVGYLAASLHIG